MKLRLPHALILALAATAAVLPASAEWAPNDGQRKNTFFFKKGDARDWVSRSTGNWVLDTTGWVYNSAAPDICNISPDKPDDRNFTINQLIASSGKTVALNCNPWSVDDSRAWNTLKIENLRYGAEDGSGSGSLDVAQYNNVEVQNVIGTLSSVTNAGSLTLNGATTIGTLTNSGTLTVNSELSLTGAATNSGTLNMGSSGRIELAKNATLTFTTAMAKGVMETMLNKTSGAGTLTLKIGNNETEMYGTNFTFNAANTVIEGSTGSVWRINSNGSTTKVYTVGAGQSLTFNNASLRLESDTTLNVSGVLSITNGNLQLGHNEAGGHYGRLNVLEGADVTLSGIKLQHNTSQGENNQVNMLGGTLTITGNSMFTSDSTPDYAVVNISGGTLKANGNSWTLGLNATLGGVTLETGATDRITIGAAATSGAAATTMTLTDTLINKGNLTLAGSFAVNSGADAYTVSDTTQNGFKVTNSIWTLVRNEGVGTTTVSEGSTFIHGTTDLDISTANGNLVGTTTEGAGTIYHIVTNGTAIDNLNAADRSKATAYYIADGVNFTGSGKDMAGKDLILGKNSTWTTRNNGDFNDQQVVNLTLLGNATVMANNNSGLIGSASPAFAPTTLTLNGHTLTVDSPTSVEKNRGHFAMFNTTVTDSGTIKVTGNGYLQVGHSGRQTTVNAKDVVLDFETGAKLTIDNNSSLTVEGLTGAGEIKKDGGTNPNLIIHADQGTKAYTFTGQITNGLNLTMGVGSTGTQNIKLTQATTLNNITMNSGTLNFSKADSAASADMTVGQIITGSGSGTAAQGAQTLLTFAQKVTLTNNSYSTISGMGNRVYFNGGMAYTGTNGYALLAGYGAKVYFGGESDLSNKRIGQQVGSELIVQSGADLKAYSVYNSTTASNNGAVTVEEGGRLETKTDGLVATTFTNAGTSVIKGTYFKIDSALLNSGDLTIQHTGAAANISVNSISQSGENAVLKLTDGVNLTTGMTQGGSIEGSYQLGTGAVLNLKNLGAEVTAALKDLTLAQNSIMGVYQGNSVPETPATANEANISVSGTLTAKAGANLNANLTMKNGSTIDVAVNSENYMAGGLTMGSSVTIERGAKVNLSDNIISGLNSLTVGSGLTLFSGVDSFTLDGTAHTVDFTSGSASNYFNLDDVNRPWDFVIKYETPAGSTGGGTLSLWMATPEPATATLSLLALAALAAKRKRR